MLWIKDEDDKDAPSFWVDPNDPEKSFSQEILSKTDGNASKQNKNEEVEHSDEIQTRVQEIEKFADFLISTSSDDIYWGEHELSGEEELSCEECKKLKEKVDKYQSHNHTFTCAKKCKTMTIGESEGHGRLDGVIKGTELSNISVCRFRFPKFPLDVNKLIIGMPKETKEDVIKIQVHQNQVAKMVGDKRELQGRPTVELLNLSGDLSVHQLGTLSTLNLTKKIILTQNPSYQAQRLMIPKTGVPGLVKYFPEITCN